MIDSDGTLCTVLNYYRCNHEGSILHRSKPVTTWSDLWICECNDRCPVCKHEVEPYKSEHIEQEED